MSDTRTGQRGQAIVLFTLALAALVMGAAVVVDGGYAFAQRRDTQNAADFAAMAGARIIGQKLIDRPIGSGTAQNVEGAINAALAANDASLVAARYVDDEGVDLGNVVGASHVPSGTFGVVVDARSDWRPFLLGALGIIDWQASARATAKTPGHSLGGGMMPIGIRADTYDDLVKCPVTDLDTCIEQNLTAGHLNIPGGFGWLKFGLQGSGGKCDWPSSLGMVADDGCQSSKTFLDSQIGPPADSHGCCTAILQPGSVDLIGSLTGNEWGDLGFYTGNRIPVWVPIWDLAGGSGTNAYYHIAGFGAIVFTGDDEHARWLEGAGIAEPCPTGTEIIGHDYCSAPGDAFVIEATGEVILVR